MYFSMLLPRTIKHLFLLLLFGFLFLPSKNSFAQEYHELEHDLVLDGVIAGTGLVFTALAESVLKKPLAKETCGWCSPPEFDLGVRNALKWDNTKLPLTLSDAIAASEFFGTLGALALIDHNKNGGLDLISQDFILMTEAVATTMVFTNIIKWTVGRQRPFAHFNGDELAASENNLSFFSGHSSLSASVAAASTTLALLRGYDEVWWILGITGTMALTTAYFRVAGDAHYFSDVISGILIGTTFGVGIPLLFHGRKGAKPSKQTQQIKLGLSSVNFQLTF